MITLQAQQADGSWHIRNYFKAENDAVRSHAMRKHQLEDLAHRAMDRWHDYHDGRTLRVHDTTKPQPRNLEHE